jgi:predicted nucleotidyltransferase
MQIIDKNIDKISTLCKAHNVARLFVFGSVLNDSLKKESDIDFLVDFTSMDISKYADNYFDLKISIEELFQREVDLLEEKALKNPYFRQSIDKSKRLIYGH